MNFLTFAGNRIAIFAAAIAVLMVYTGCSKEVPFDCTSSVELEVSPTNGSYVHLPYDGVNSIDFRNVEDGSIVSYQVNGADNDKERSILCAVPCPEDEDQIVWVRHLSTYRSVSLFALNSNELHDDMRQIEIEISVLEDYSGVELGGVADALVIQTYSNIQVFEDSEPGQPASSYSRTPQMIKVLYPGNYPEAYEKEKFTYHESFGFASTATYEEVYETVNESSGLEIYYHMELGIVLMEDHEGSIWERVWPD